MNHRGACGCEPDSGDGAGIMVRLPDAFLRRKCTELGIILPPLNQYGVANVFLPQDMVQRNECQRILEKVVADYGMVTLGWRDVPVDNRQIGPTPRRCEPRIRQIFVGMGSTFYNRRDFDRRLYLVRQRENSIEFSDLPESARSTFYVAPQRFAHHLQGDAHGASGPQLFPRPQRAGFRVRPGRHPFALQHQHLPVLGPCPSLPIPGPQRRDQHPARQPQLDAGPIRLAAIGNLRRRIAEDVPHPHRIRIGHRDHRQRASVPDYQRPNPGPQHADAHPRGLAEQSQDG